MTYTHYNAKPGSHLSDFERGKIEAWKAEGISNREIARRLGRSPQTINNEVKRGIVHLKRLQRPGNKVYTYYNKKYCADVGQRVYQENRQNCGRKPIYTQANPFLEWADRMMLEEKWSPGAVIAKARRERLFLEAMIPCTTTLYDWIDQGVMNTRNIDLPEKVSRREYGTLKKVEKRPSTLGRSIDERDESINQREVFGHWEIDTVIGGRDKEDDAILSLLERKTRTAVLLKIPSKTFEAVNTALSQLEDKAGDLFEKVFQSVTADNGKEFTSLNEALESVIDVYYAHPYASHERGSQENMHRLIRRFIPKGKRIEDVSYAELERIQRWINSYPRKILGYASAQECFLEELETLQNVA